MGGTSVLGISCYYHDAAACLVVDGKIVAAAQEERFTRKRHDPAFPANAARYCLAQGRLGKADLDTVVFYDKPLLKFHRILETYLSVAPKGIRSFVRALPIWIKEKLWISPQIQDSLQQIGVDPPDKVLFAAHHESHAASAFYPSPFSQAAVVTIDGVGEWATTTIGVGEDHQLRLIRQIEFPHSLGLLYSAFTYFTGFRVNSGEYKLMGLAPYGRGVYTDTIKEHLIDVREDGSFRLNMEYFGFLDGLVMTNDKFAALFGGPPRAPESRITRREMDLAKSVQEVTEEVVCNIAREAKRVTGKKHLCLAGGVALNCVANGKLLRENIFEDVWIQPAAGDAGGAVGAALTVWHNMMQKPRTVAKGDSMRGSYLGPEFSQAQICAYLDEHGYPYQLVDDADWAESVAKLLANEKVVGLFQGRMEFGPRALGNRSIIGDPRSPKMQSIMNLKIKYRESFRPFAPSCLEEKVSEYFELDRPSPYMLLVAQVAGKRCFAAQGDEYELSDLLEWVNRARSELPAITHVDYSARIQTVHRDTNPRYHQLLREFERLTGYGVLINTSFNVRGEPIVCTPQDAYRCFMRTEMDVLSLGPFLLDKTKQPDWQDKENWQETFALD